eukprot:Rhum_TRINITY_DN14612_c10_g2::Rhum_TRINITY_DN14612_c10_g2_i1::g.105169::m.105169
MTTQLDFSPCALAEEFWTLRFASKLDEAVAMFSEDCHVEFPAIFSNNVAQGKAALLAKWKEQDKDGMPKFKNITKFALVKDCQRVVERTMEASKLILTLKIKHTIWFNKEGKISKMTLKKM